MEKSPNKNTERRTSRRKLGDRGEEIACQWYIARGFEIVEQNVSISRVGEIDVIASRENGNRIDLVFAEVKARSGNSAGYGYEAVNKQKRIRMMRSAMAWIRENVEYSRNRIAWRLDVVSIDTSTSPCAISVFENIEV